MKSRVIVLAAFLSLVTILSACGNDSGQKNPTSSSGGFISSPGSGNQVRSSADTSKKVNSNAEAFLGYARRVAKGVDFMGSGDYAKFMYALGNEYKYDIVNPYTGETYMDISNRTIRYFKAKDDRISQAYSVDFIAIDDYMTELKDLDTSEVVYCLNPSNKGCTLAFLLVDGIYIYEVDENGNKKNEIKHFFKDDGLGN